jgi:hypothetical protein
LTTFAYDPLWNGQTEASTGAVSIKEEIAYYQCDHLGTPRELTDHQGDIAWAAQYKACGQAKEVSLRPQAREGVETSLPVPARRARRLRLRRQHPGRTPATSRCTNAS